MKSVNFPFTAKKVEAHLLLFLIIYGPYIKIGPIVFHSMRFMGALLSFYFIYLLFNNKIKKNFILPMLLSVVHFSLVAIIYHNSIYRDSELITSSLLFLFYFFSAYSLKHVLWQGNKKLTSNELLDILFNVTFYNACILILIFVSPSIKELAYGCVVIDGNKQSEEFFFQRVIGINGMGGANLSYLIFLGMAAGIFSQRDVRKRIYKFIIIGVSFIITGRTGLFLLIIFLPAIVIWKNIVKVGILKGVVNSVIVVSIFIIFVAIIYKASYYFGDLFPGLIGALNRTFESYNYYIKTNAVFDNTIFHILQNMYFLPESIWFGVGSSGRNYNETGFYLYSDVGYVRSLFAFGLIGSISQISIFAYILYKVSKSKSCDSLRMFLIIAILSLFVFQAKENPFQDATICFVIFLYFFLCSDLSRFKHNQEPLVTKTLKEIEATCKSRPDNSFL